MTQVPVSRPGGSFASRAAQPVILLAIMWAIFLVDIILPGSLPHSIGVESWLMRGIDGVMLSPLVHANLGHIAANTAPFAILGVLAALDGVGRFWAVTAIAAFVSGTGTWFVNAPGTLTVGASGLVFGYFGYLLVRAFVARSLGHRILYALIAIGVGVAYGGSMITGVIAASPGISWQAHLFGAIGGGAAALLLRPRRGRTAA